MSLHRPSAQEDEYFAREDAEKKRKQTLQAARTMAQSEREARRALHGMHCPKCGMDMQEITHSGWVALRCFHCNGVFIDADDIQKLLGKEGYWTKIFEFLPGPITPKTRADPWLIPWARSNSTS